LVLWCGTRIYLLFQIRYLELDGHLDVITRRLLIDSIVDVTRLRAERLHLSAEHLSPVIRGVILFLSVVIVASFTFRGVGSLGIHIFMVVLLGLAVAFLNLGLADLASPLVGLWNVSPEPFQEIVRGLAEPVPRAASISA
jgi:phosphotransferase system  glucose/maltose/N-acetylglucosamine-specific IIC component